MSRVILASASPRRRELLSQMGLAFEILTSDAGEQCESTQPCDMVQELSALKAEAVFGKLPVEEREDVLIIGADTLVAYENRVMGKPGSEKQAEEMLLGLQGNTHQVYTGVTILFTKKGSVRPEIHTFFEKTDVTMFPMSLEEIRAYVATKEPMDKAGAYGIQGRCAVHIEKITGDYYNVVGLPIGSLYQKLKALLW